MTKYVSYLSFMSTSKLENKGIVNIKGWEHVKLNGKIFMEGNLYVGTANTEIIDVIDIEFWNIYFLL